MRKVVSVVTLVQHGISLMDEEESSMYLFETLKIVHFVIKKVSVWSSLSFSLFVAFLCTFMHFQPSKMMNLSTVASVANYSYFDLEEV